LGIGNFPFLFDVIVIRKKFFFISSLFFIFILVTTFVTIQFAESRLAPKTNLEHYIENDLILVGKIISAIEISDIKQTEYQIEVERYIKNPQNLDQILAFGRGLKNDTSQSSIDITFDESNRVLLFLNKVEDRYVISPYSVTAALFDPDEGFILPPLKLYKAGILSNEIVCRGDLVLVLKASNDSPACIKAEHVERLTTSGWLERMLTV